MNQSWYSTLCSFITTISIRVKLNQRLLRFFFTLNQPLREAFAHLANTYHHTQTDYWYNCTIGMYVMCTIISIKLLVIAIGRWCPILSWTWLKPEQNKKWTWEQNGSISFESFTLSLKNCFADERVIIHNMNIAYVIACNDSLNT